MEVHVLPFNEKMTGFKKREYTYVILSSGGLKCGYRRIEEIRGINNPQDMNMYNNYSNMKSGALESQYLHIEQSEEFISHGKYDIQCIIITILCINHAMPLDLGSDKYVCFYGFH